MPSSSSLFRWKRASTRLPTALSLGDCRKMHVRKEDTSRIIGDGKCSTVSPASSEDASTADSCSMTLATDSSSATLEEVNGGPLLAVGAVDLSVASTRICIEKCGQWETGSGSCGELQMAVVDLGGREDPDGHSVSSGSVDLDACTTMKDI